MTTDLTPVAVGPCLCPGTPHADGDVVYLRPRLDLRGGFRVKRRLLDLNRAAYQTNGDAPSAAAMADLEFGLAEAYLDEGIAEWNLVDEDGESRPVTPEAIREFLSFDYSRSEVVADKADDLYRPAVLDPLLDRALSSSQTTPTKKSISAKNGHGSKPPRQSKPSSTSVSPMADTVKIT